MRLDFNPRSLAGATSRPPALLPVLTYFNPRSLAGATQRGRCRPGIHGFQSTLPRGSDPQPATPHIQAGNFNPRSLAGATLRQRQQADRHNEFQSTLPRGSDGHKRRCKGSHGTISIHAPSRERPKGDTGLQGPQGISIHAPSRERRYSLYNERQAA